MLKWLIFLAKRKKKKKTNNSCESCVYWKSEESFNKQVIGQNVRYCGFHKEYKHKMMDCYHYTEEKFEPHEGSITSEELNLDLDSVIEKVKKEGNQNDTE